MLAEARHHRAAEIGRNRALLALDPRSGDLIAEGSQNSHADLEQTAEPGGRGHIPTQRDREFQRPIDAAPDYQRNIDERFFNKLRSLRKVAMLNVKSSRISLAVVLMAS